MILEIYKKGDKFSCENHRGISSIGNALTLFADIIFPGYSVLVKGMRARIKLISGPAGVVLTKFSLQRILEHKHILWAQNFYLP